MIETIDYPFSFGMVHTQAEEATKIAKTRNVNVRIMFNDIELIVEPDSTVREICTLYDLKSLQRRMKMYE